MKTGMKQIAQPVVDVVNFEITNKVPPVQGLKECKKEIMQGYQNVWYEYVPEFYDGSRKVPLVVQIHGGGNDGKRWAEMTIWHELAEKEGFIVIYPNSPEYGCWPCEEEDIQYVYDLISHIKSKYVIDETRVYMQGMSNGDMMTLAFSMRYPEVLAGAAYMTGPSAEEILDGDMPSGALPIIQMRGELDINWNLTRETTDIYENRYKMNDLNREIWEKVNGTEDIIPILSIEGKDNYLYYKGTNAVIINWEIQGMGHREPVYSSQVVWDRLYSGCKRENGAVIIDKIIYENQGDKDIVIIAAGANKVYSSGKIISISEMKTASARIMLPAETAHFCPVELEEMCETEVMCVPAEFFVQVYNAKLAYQNSGERAILMLEDKRVVILMADSLLVYADGKYLAMQKPCIQRCGVFYVPVAEFCQIILNKQVSMADDVMCITNHYALLGRYTARIIRKLLGGTLRPRRKEDIKWRDDNKE